MEYIARHSDTNPSDGAFSAEDILYISEIGLVVNNVEEVYRDINSHFGIKKYSTSSNQFLAIGNELGLILLMGTNTKAAFNKGRKREIYDTEIFLNHKESLPKLKFAKYPYRFNTI